jgi:hypothetical protein
MTRITSVNKSNAPAPAKKAKAASGAFAPSNASAPASAAKTEAAAPTATLSALIALQSDAYDRGRGAGGKTIAAAQQVLGELERLQHALLDGRADKGAVEALEAAAALRAHAGADARLLEIYDEISLRARVELAKLGR